MENIATYRLLNDEERINQTANHGWSEEFVKWVEATGGTDWDALNRAYDQWCAEGRDRDTCWYLDMVLGKERSATWSVYFRLIS